MSIQPREPSGHARKAARGIFGYRHDVPMGLLAACDQKELADAAEIIDRLAVSPAVEEVLKYLRALTPGGSEYQTAEECAAYARRVRDEQFAAVRKFKAERAAERERADGLAESLKEAGDVAAEAAKDALLCAQEHGDGIGDWDSEAWGQSKWIDYASADDLWPIYRQTFRATHDAARSALAHGGK